MIFHKLGKHFIGNLQIVIINLSAIGMEAGVAGIVTVMTEYVCIQFATE